MHTEGATPLLRKYAFFALGELGDFETPGVLEALQASLDKVPPYVYEESLEKATAVVALGLLGQRAAAATNQKGLMAFDRICDALVQTASDSGEEAKGTHPNVKGNGKYLIREDASLGLLLLCAARPQVVVQRQPRLVAVLAKMAADDEDRYVLGYAIEALRSLAESGCDEARQAMLEALLCVAKQAGDDNTIARVQKVLCATPSSDGQGSNQQSLAHLANMSLCPRTAATSPF